MGTRFLGEKINYARTDLFQRQNFTRCVEFRGCFRHAIHGAGCAILRNRVMPLFMEGEQSFGSIPSHAGKDHSHDVTAPISRHTFEKYID